MTSAESTREQRFQVVPSVYLIFLRGDAVLLQYRCGNGYRDDHWAVGAAGHIEAGESAFTAGVREAGEELGLRLDDGALIPVCTLHRRETGDGSRGTYEDERADYFFLVTEWSGDPVIMEPDKAADLRWFPLQALPDPVVPHERLVLEALRAERAGGPTVPPIMASGW